MATASYRSTPTTRYNVVRAPSVRGETSSSTGGSPLDSRLDRVSEEMLGSDYLRYTPNSQGRIPTRQERAQQVSSSSGGAIAVNNQGGQTSLVAGPNAPGQTPTSPTTPPPAAAASETSSESGAGSQADTANPKWDMYNASMKDMWDLYNQNNGQWGDISNKIGESEAQQQAQAKETGRLSQSRLDRQAAEMRALRGGSVGGGGAQAGAAQANLVGRQQLQQQMTDISKWGSEAKMANVRNMIASRNAMIDRMNSNAQQMASLASNAEEAKAARDAMARIQGTQNEASILSSMIESGNIENPDEVMRLFYEGQGAP